MSLNIEQLAGGSDFPLIDAGTYEVVLKISKKSTKDGKGTYLNLDFMIRDDIEQKFQKQHVFEKAFPDPTNEKWFDTRKLANILVTQQNREGYKKEWENCDELILWLNDSTLKITVEKVFDDYRNEEVNRVKMRSYEATEAGPYVKPEKAKNGAVENSADQAQAGGNIEGIEIPADKLPF